MPDRKNISREEMRQYLEGKLTGKAAHRVERHLLENPFEQEAMEGFEGFDQTDIDSDLASLDQRIRKKKSSQWIIYRMAASVLLLLCAGVAVWVLVDKVTPQNQIAFESEDRKTESSNVGPEKIAPVTPPTIPTEQPSKEKQAIESAPQPSIAVEESEPTQAFEELDDVPQTLADADIETESIYEEIALDEMDSGDQLQGAVAGVSVNREKREVVADEPTEKKIMIRGTSSLRSASVASMEEGHLVRGTVTDDSGDPVPGANVIVKGKTSGSMTDIDGNYEIEVQQGEVLLFSFIGYDAAEIKVDDRQTINVELETDVQSLSEVVVVGYGTSDDTKTETSYESARPRIGMREYKDYLERELSYPAKAVENEVEGKVILKVTILASGEIGNIEVRRSLGFGCDEEAIRLVKEGPAWLPAQKDVVNTESQVRVKVKFELD